jgi:hypothetical protein
MRRLLNDLATWVLLVYAVLLPSSFGLGWLATTGRIGFRVSLVVSVAGFVLVGCFILVWLSLEEDWWDDYREQTRGLLVLSVLHLVASPAAWFWGRAAGG